MMRKGVKWVNVHLFIYLPVVSLSEKLILRGCHGGQCLAEKGEVGSFRLHDISGTYPTLPNSDKRMQPLPPSTPSRELRVRCDKLRNVSQHPEPEGTCPLVDCCYHQHIGYLTSITASINGKLYGPSLTQAYAKLERPES